MIDLEGGGRDVTEGAAQGGMAAAPLPLQLPACREAQG